MKQHDPQHDPPALSYNAKYEIHNRIFDTSAVLSRQAAGLNG